jgi:hypothetical protein
MASSLILIPLFFAIVMWTGYNIGEINKVTMSRNRGFGLHLTRTEWRLIGKHFLYLLLGFIAFVFCLLLLYLFKARNLI